MKYILLSAFMFLSGCLAAEDMTINHYFSDDHTHTHEFPCSYVKPYRYNATYCDSGWDYECCTWYIGWGCREEWCISRDSCGWEFIDDYCVY